jgi:hypothetical protein
MVKRRNDEVCDGTSAAAMGLRDDEDAATERDLKGRQYGRRIEADRSWTIYHVFTGVPASAGGQAMTGLSRADATRGMLSLNRENVARRKESLCPSEQGNDAVATMAAAS